MTMTDEQHREIMNTMEAMYDKIVELKELNSKLDMDNTSLLLEIEELKDTTPMINTIESINKYRKALDLPLYGIMNENNERR